MKRSEPTLQRPRPRRMAPAPGTPTPPVGRWWWLVAAAAVMMSGGPGCGRRDSRLEMGRSAPFSTTGTLPVAVAPSASAPPPLVPAGTGRKAIVNSGSEAAADPASEGSSPALLGTPGTPELSPDVLPVEERDRDPGSEMVTVKIVVDPPQRAHVFWGPKDLGLAPLEIQRPRGSGPIDLILRAPGYLTLHTRAFTDRHDKIYCKLVAESDASRMLGYHPR